MPWIAAAAGGIASLIGSNSAANKAQDAQDRATAVARDNQTFQQNRANVADSMLIPTEQKMMAEANGNGPTSYYGQEKGQFEGGMAKARAGVLNQTGGIGTGQQAEEMSTLGLNEAKGLGSLQAQDDVRKVGLRQQLAATTEGQAGQAAGAAGMASSTLSGQDQSQARYYQQMAASGAAGFSSAMKNGMASYQQFQNGQNGQDANGADQEAYGDGNGGNW